MQKLNEHRRAARGGAKSPIDFAANAAAAAVRLSFFLFSFLCSFFFDFLCFSLFFFVFLCFSFFVSGIKSTQRPLQFSPTDHCYHSADHHLRVVLKSRRSCMALLVIELPPWRLAVLLVPLPLAGAPPLLLPPSTAAAAEAAAADRLVADGLAGNARPSSVYTGPMDTRRLGAAIAASAPPAANASGRFRCGLAVVVCKCKPNAATLPCAAAMLRTISSRRATAGDASPPVGRAAADGDDSTANENDCTFRCGELGDLSCIDKSDTE
jgi:hypothetical protein